MLACVSVYIDKAAYFFSLACCGYCVMSFANKNTAAANIRGCELVVLACQQNWPRHWCGQARWECLVLPHLCECRGTHKGLVSISDGLLFCCVIVAPLALSSDISRDWFQDMVGWHECKKDSRLDEKDWRGGGFSKNWLGGLQTETDLRLLQAWPSQRTF